MEYSVGSLADLISGKNTPNKLNVIEKCFTPFKQEFEKSGHIFADAFKIHGQKSGAIKEEEHIKQEKKLKISLLRSKKVVALQKTSRKGERKSLKIKSKRALNSPQTSSIKGDGKSKGPKRKLDKSEVDIADSDEEEISPKIQKLSKNEKNAASRIKNKKNRDNKTSGEYKDKTVFVGNIPINITKEKIKKHFRKYGLIDSVRIRGVPVANPKTTKKIAAIKKEFHPDRNTIYAFIRYKNSEDARKAEAENGVLFLEHHLRVHCCELNDKPDESKAIFVGNLPFNAEEEELWNLFKVCGLISHCRIVRDGRTNMGKGFGYVNFKDTDAVQLALEMEKVILKGRELRVSLCDSSRAKKKKMDKIPRNRSKQLEKGQENDYRVACKEKFFRNKTGTKGEFTGTKLNEIKRKKKSTKVISEKKILAKKLLAPSYQ